MISWLCVCASWTMIMWKDPAMLFVTSTLFDPAFQLKIETTQLAAVLVGDDPFERPRIHDLLLPRVQTIRRLRGCVGLAPNNHSDPCFFSQRVRQARRSPEPCRSFVFRLVRFARVSGRKPRVSFIGNCSSDRFREGQSAKHFFIFSGCSFSSSFAFPAS